MPIFAYLFEARSIQQYIFETGKLKDMVGASYIVDYLCKIEGDDLIGSVLKELNLLEGKDIRFSRRAGGSFVGLMRDEIQAKLLRNLWTLTVSHYAPGLEWVDALTQGDSDMDAVTSGFDTLARRRNLPSAVFPEIGPFVLRAPRTGRAAVERDKKDDCLDVNTLIKRGQKNVKEIGEKFVSATNGEKVFWVKTLEAETEDEKEFCMPFIPEAEKIIGILHVDGNGLGIALRKLQKVLQNRDDYQSASWLFSSAITKTTTSAAQKATNDVLLPAAPKNGTTILPARPLVLGGDDLTMIVRGDLAMDYASSFIRHFETESEINLKALSHKIKDLPQDFPKKLSACGGVAFIRLKQPFSQAYSLAESLCSYSKKISEGFKKSDNFKPSCVSFYRVTTSYIGEYSEILENIERFHMDNTCYQMTMGAYSITEEMVGYPRWDDLKAFHELLCSMKGVAARDFLTILRQSPHIAKDKYQRWREIMENTQGEKTLKDFDEGLKKLGVTDRDLPFTKESNGIRRTPFGDLHDLTSVLQIHK